MTYSEKMAALVEQAAYRRRAAAGGLRALLAPYVASDPRVPAQREVSGDGHPARRRP